ncbi:MAG TPA: hypothetical protein GX521_07290 [Firmicutes bacterium]|nr:hypothetical protein [Bacillota bacterium]
MSKRAKVHFLTLYVEYLLDQGIRSEEYYLGDASRFLRHLLATATPRQVEEYILTTTDSATYRRRLEKTLRKFFIFAEERLAISPPELPRGIKKTR